MKFSFLCKDKHISPSIGIPVYVKDEALKKRQFPRKHRGGTIVEDVSFVTIEGVKYYAYHVKHANGTFLWAQDDLIEIGGININVNSKEGER